MAEGWQSLSSCISPKLPASRARPNTFFANSWKQTPRRPTGTWANTYGWWRDGFIAIRAKARFSFTKKTGRIVGFSGRVRGFSHRKRAARIRTRRPGRRNRPKEHHDQIRNQRRNNALRAEVRGPCRHRPFSRSAPLGALFRGDWHVPRATGRKDG